MGQTCSNCSTYYEGNFCNNCGQATPEEDKLPFIGESLEKGIYEITFAPVKGEFSHPDTARDAARHSAWGEDREFGEFLVHKIESTVTPETHPYICGKCKNMVAETNEGRCDDCGENEWIKR